MPITLNSVESITAECSHDRLATVVRVTYANTPDGSTEAVEARAPQSVQRFGEIVREIAAPWLQRNVDAEELATRTLRRDGRPVWIITAEITLDESEQPGQRVDVDHPTSPVVGSALIQSATHDESTNRTELVAEIPAGQAPTVTVQRLLN